jgi:hypothetical protein
VFGLSALALVDSDEGGSGFIANEPSGKTVLYFRNHLEPYVTVDAGFLGLSFQYSSGAAMTLTLYDGANGSGAVLATVGVPTTGLCTLRFPACGDPTGTFGRWFPLSVPPLPGVARSFRFSGGESLAGIDDMVISLCTQTTYWLWNPQNDTVVGELLNNSASCIAVPYNVEVRTCSPPATSPVRIKLMNSTFGTIKNQKELAAPFFLWGDNTATGDVFRNTQPLPIGTYKLISTIDTVTEQIAFTQTC